MTKRARKAAFNALSVVMLGLTAMACACYATVFFVPALAGPLAGPARANQAALPIRTPTPTATVWPPTWTPAVTGTSRPSDTPVIVSTPTPANTPTPASATLEPAKKTVLLRVPLLAQARPLTCEAACARMVATFLGKPASEARIQEQFGRDENPHKGFRGDVRGEFGDVFDYGVYAEPVAKVLQSLGLNAKVRYGTGYADLRDAIDKGQPVIVWLSLFDAPGHYDQPGGYRLVPGEHTYVVVGYDAAGLVVNDPGKGGQQFHVRTIPHWELFDNMAVVVSK